MLGASGGRTTPSSCPVPASACWPCLSPRDTSCRHPALAGGGPLGPFTGGTANETVEDFLAGSLEIATLALGGKLTLDGIAVIRVHLGRSGLLRVVALVKIVLHLQVLEQKRLLKLLRPFVGDELRRLDGAHHRQPLGPLLLRSRRCGRIGLLWLALLKLLGGRPKPPCLGRFPLGPLGAVTPPLGLGLAAGPLGGGGYIAIGFFALPFFFAIIAAGIGFIPAIAFGIAFLAFIFDFAKV